jgi:hypothetical protein
LAQATEERIVIIASNLKRMRGDVIVNVKSTIGPPRVVTHGTRIFVVVVSMLVVPDRAAAYVDPGTTGMLSQILYVLFYGAMGLFFYYLRSVKEHIANAKQFLGRLFARRG